MKKSKQRLKSQKKSPRKPFSEHLGELRTRALWCLFFFGLATAIVYPFYSILLSWLIKPLHQTVYYTSPTGGLSLIIQICLFFGFLLALPALVFHLYRFVEPIIPKTTSKWITVSIIVASSVLTCCGVGLAYFVSLPTALRFLQTFDSNQVSALITANEYFSFVIQYLLGFGILFQLPLVLLLWNYISPLKSKALISYSRYVIILSAIVAAILTPTPDPINQAFMAGPIIILYYLSVLIIWRLNKKTEKKSA